MLRGLESRIIRAEEYVQKIDSANYDWYQDNDANLDIRFKSGKLIELPVFPFRPYQLEIQRELFINDKQFFDLEWPRRAGKEVVSWNMLIHAALLYPGLYLMIYPNNVRGKSILWKGSIVMPDGAGHRFLDMIPKKFLLSKPNNIEMTAELINGSIIKVAGAYPDPDKFRGMNPRGVVISEYAFCDPRVRLILSPILRQNGGWMMLQSTPNGMNHAYDLMRELKGNPEWFCRTETCETLIDENGKRYISDAMIDAERKAGMPEWLIEQEYYCKVESNSEIYYFSKEMAYINNYERIIEGLLLQKPVYVGFDIGWSDTTAVTLFQLDPSGWPVVIYYFEKNNKLFEWYVNQAKEFCEQRNLYIKTYFVPHDGENKNFATGKNVVDVGQEIGVDVQVVKRPPSMSAAIQSMRRMLPKTRFAKEGTERLRQCLSNYQKDYDDKMGVYRKDPLHNWASHGVKSFQTMTYAIDEQLISEHQGGMTYYRTN